MDDDDFPDMDLGDKDKDHDAGINVPNKGKPNLSQFENLNLEPSSLLEDP